MKQNNVSTGAAAKHSGKMPSSSKETKAKVSGYWGRSTPVTPNVTPQTGHRSDLPGQK